MKKLLTIITLTAFAAAPATVLAAKKEKEAAAPAAAPAAAAPAAAKPAETKPAAKAIGMSTKVDAIDAATKSFTHTNKDGKVVKFNVLDTTEIKNGDAAAKFEDIKVGDTVNGSRLKKSDTEYDVVKITKFGADVGKAKKDKKADGEKKAPEPAAPAAPAKKTT